MSRTEEIRNYALDLGYSRVGITTAEPFPLYASPGGALAGLRLGGRQRPSPPARCQSAGPPAGEPDPSLSAVYDYFRSAFRRTWWQDRPPLSVALVHRAADAARGCPGGTHAPVPGVEGMQSGARYMISSGVPDRLAAVRAGLGQIGRNTFFCAPGIGTFRDHPYLHRGRRAALRFAAEGTHCPPDCRLCIEACPTGAIVADYRLNPRRASPSATLSTFHGFQNTSPYIDPEIRPKMGSWIHGCDLCQEACPRNRDKLKAKLPENAFLEEAAKHFT